MKLFSSIFFAKLVGVGMMTGLGSGAYAQELPNPILFVTQFPVPADFTTIGAVFGNHKADLQSAGRGGDLYILYPDGSLKNLTRAAGYGKTGPQSGTGIAVRQPCVHWSGTKAVFSMVIGAPQKQFQAQTYYWQLYEISGLGKNETPVITKVPRQPGNFNNISPIYGTDDRIIFTTDRPRSGEMHLYPQLDEYEEAPTVTGLWSLDPASGDLIMLNHTPSGAFSPLVDSFGRVLFTRWDHLQRDQQADSDAEDIAKGQLPGYKTFNFSDETATAMVLLNDRTEIFPEPRIAAGNLMAHTFNQFFPWQIHEDGTEEETLNHVGRHEMTRYIQQSFTDDPNLDTFYNVQARYNTNYLENFIQMAEDPTHPGTYVGVDAPEFATHAAGQLLSIDGPPTLNPDLMRLTYLTPQITKNTTDSNSPDHTGLYRNPLPLSDGRLISVHTSAKVADKNMGTSDHPASLYDFRIKLMKKVGGFYQPDKLLTPGITNPVSYYNPDTLVSYSGAMWELDPVEVRVRPRPTRISSHVPDPEQQVFSAEAVDIAAFQNFMRSNQVALIVSRNVTTRDQADKEQPYNLQVAGTSTKTAGASGKVYDISHLQFFEGDQLRGVFGGDRAGRRVLANYMHGEAALNNPNINTAPVSSVQLGADGSMAAFVPARRAMTWQLTDPNGIAVVRERYWITFQPGEIRSRTSCHGINQKDQAGNAAPINPPEALRVLLRDWKARNGLANQIRITEAKHSAGKFSLKASGSDGQVLILQSSIDLKVWNPIKTNSVTGTLPANWDLDLGDGAGAGFFRIVSP
jgi:hypothetical protein